MSDQHLVTPVDLRDFLKARGWRLNREAMPHRLYAMSNDQYPKRQLVFPMDITPDYDEAVRGALEKFADIASLKWQALLAALATVRDDVLRFRVFFDGDDRSLPLSFASSLVNSTEKLLKATACTVVLPRTSHPRLNLAEASQFVDKARFNQTEEGSFILSVSCPVNSMDAQSRIEFNTGDAPFVRKVTISLQRALYELVSAIEGDELDTLVDELKSSKAPIISSNFCEALVAMHDEQVDNALEISFDWSSLREAPKAHNLSRLRFQRDYFPRVEEVGRELTTQNRDEVDTFVGTVERLEGEMGTDGRRSGPVVLALLLPEGETVRARTVLDADSYLKADKAHMSAGAYVRVTGVLKQGRQPRLLTETTSFELL
ncbi:hypothetical protein V7798_17460 [Rhizobium laguerreae]